MVTPPDAQVAAIVAAHADLCAAADRHVMAEVDATVRESLNFRQVLDNKTPTSPDQLRTGYPDPPSHQRHAIAGAEASLEQESPQDLGKCAGENLERQPLSDFRRDGICSTPLARREQPGKDCAEHCPYKITIVSQWPSP
jgi:hypothetical protein